MYTPRPRPLGSDNAIAAPQAGDPRNSFERMCANLEGQGAEYDAFLKNQNTEFPIAPTMTDLLAFAVQRAQRAAEEKRMSDEVARTRGGDTPWGWGSDPHNPPPRGTIGSNFRTSTVPQDLVVRPVRLPENPSVAAQFEKPEPMSALDQTIPWDRSLSQKRILDQRAPPIWPGEGPMDSRAYEILPKLAPMTLQVRTKLMGRVRPR